MKKQQNDKEVKSEQELRKSSEKERAYSSDEM